MRILLPEQTYTSQPQTNATISQCALNAGLVRAWNFTSTNPADSMLGKPIAYTSSAPTMGVRNGPTSGGVTCAVPDATNGTRYDSGISINNYSDHSILWVWQPSVAYNSGIIEEMWAQITSSPTLPEFSCQKFSNDQWYCGWNRSGSDHRVNLAATATNWDNTKIGVYMLTCKSGGVSTLYMNGTKLGSNGGTTTTGGATGPTFKILFQGEHTSNSKGPLAMFAIFSQALSQDEAIQYTINPWRVYSKKRTFYINSVSASSFIGGWALNRSRIVGAGYVS